MSAPILLHDDCLDILRTLDPDSVDAIVTDPPYGLSNLSPAQVTAAIVAWAGGDREHVPDSRGFMGRDWDAFVPPPAVWDECLRVLKPGGHLACFAAPRTMDLMGLSIRLAGFEMRDGIGTASLMAWMQGSGFPKSKTVLKPAWEPIMLARKPFKGSEAANVLAHGTGALNIDGTRVAGETVRTTRNTALDVMNDDGWQPKPASFESHPAGRWPANVLLSHGETCGGVCTPGCPVAELDAQSGTSTSKSGGKTTHALGVMNDDAWVARELPRTGHDDSGGASRFFPTFRYQAKAPSKERPRIDGVSHPTVKPLALMQWLVRLITPPGGLVLDPFTGTGTTLRAAQLEGFDSFGIERDRLAYRMACIRLDQPDPDAKEAV